MTKRLLIIYTGGTIGMQQTPAGLAPAPDLAAEIRHMPELGQAFQTHPPLLETLSYDPLLDSSDMTPGRWVQITRDILQHYQHYDGFVVLHGTDTLAYTASALSFFLERTDKPVVITGAQLPFAYPRSDARNNLISALEVAANMPASMTQVCVVFGSRILRGNRAIKVSAKAYDAFDSPRYPHLGTIGIDIEYNRRRRFPVGFGNFTRHGQLPPDDAVALVRLFPGFSATTLRAICGNSNLRGIVLEAYGAGNGPGQNQDFQDTIRDAVHRGIVVVVVSQPLDGIVRMSSYAAGSALARAGAISGRDMTTEAALTKLYYLIALGYSADNIAKNMKTPVAGEMRR
ncbi:asparaginase [Pseudohongiella sp.]|uniref:asparaginase n=1 Tax=marine sediment metagenome TaxID=412755 RepID=A0A0F9V565_9ZZZZ|nr:asparaginase [Pseudohongiella sp.]HDZ08897.1 asparaginase [Pseudohongiella sp.]HEA64025.1 asparaginase [Pseudohongiella sp.]